MIVNFILIDGECDFTSIIAEVTMRISELTSLAVAVVGTQATAVDERGIG